MVKNPKSPSGTIVRMRGRPSNLTDPSSFGPELFKRLQADMKSGRTPLKRMKLTDPQMRGLTVNLYPSDDEPMSWYVQYAPDGRTKRPFIKVGEFPETSIEHARRRARVIHTLAEKGIDVQDGLHKRLMRELDEKGEKWRP